MYQSVIGRLALAAATAVGIAAVATTASNADRSASPDTTVRPCSSRAEPGWRPRNSDLVMGFSRRRNDGTVRSHLDEYAEAKPSLFASRAPRYYGQLKTPIAVKAGHTVTLEVLPHKYASFIFDHRRHGRQIGPYWSFRVSDGTPRVRLTACPADEPMFSGPGTVGPWTAFPGAMVVAGARCLTLVVRERGRPTIAYYTGFGKNDCRARPPHG